jgi:hypothetical protein
LADVLHHRQIAVAVTKGGNGAMPHKQVNSDWLIGGVIVEGPLSVLRILALMSLVLAHFPVR